MDTVGPSPTTDPAVTDPTTLMTPDPRQCLIQLDKCKNHLKKSIDQLEMCSVQLDERNDELARLTVVVSILAAALVVVILYYILPIACLLNKTHLQPDMVRRLLEKLQGKNLLIPLLENVVK